MDPIFIQRIKNTFGEDGEAWLSALPGLIAEASHRWGLTDIQPVPNLSYNFVSLALSGANESERSRSAHPSATSFGKLTPPLRKEVILKLGVPNRELTGEIAALRFFNGRGACRLLDADAEKGMLLLERLQPGRMLSALKDDEHATRIAAEVMRQLWKPIPANGDDFILLKDWFEGFKRLRQRYDGDTGPLPEKLVETAESLSNDLLTENKDETLLHGDFHHFNVLESERGWLAIDPKGAIGPKGYEVGPFIINPVDRFLNGHRPRRGNNPQACPERSRRAQTEKRIAILSEMLGMERERIRSWAICHAVLSAWWNVEDSEDWTYAIRCAKIFLTT